VMDSLGMERVALPDVELALDPTTDPGLGAAFLLDVSQYHLGRGAPIPAGETIDGPGGRYRAERESESTAAPFRPVVRLTPT
jgi:hypothetical protein